MTKLLTPAELSEMLDIPERTLGQWRYIGRGPRFIRAGRHVRYDPVDVEVWKAAEKRQRADAPPPAA